MDFILNGRAFGSVASALMKNDFDVGALRPYEGSDGKAYVALRKGGKLESVPIYNANTTLRKDEWTLLDSVVMKAAKARLRAVSDLRSRGLEYVIPNGLAKTVLQYEAQSDITPADVSMDGLRQSESDRPEYSLVNLPLPIIDKEFRFSARQIAVSRNGSTPLDTTMVELAARKVAELAEQMLLGLVSPGSMYAYGGGTIYGYLDFPGRIPHSLTAPTASGWGPATLVRDVLTMKSLSQAQFHYGPWMCYISPDWDVYLDDDYSSQKGDNTLRDRIRAIEGIEDVVTLDYMTGWDVLLVQMTSDVVREVVGMDITTLQWESRGGLEQNFKVMAILVPQLREDYYGNTGIVHGRVL